MTPYSIIWMLHLLHVSSTSEPTSLPAVIKFYGSTLTITDCTFTGNKISSIKAISSNVTVSGKILFHNNTASSGTGLIFAKNSCLVTTDYSNIHFQNNHAINHGGVFYITTEELYETSMSLQDVIHYNGVGSLILPTWKMKGHELFFCQNYKASSGLAEQLCFFFLVASFCGPPLPKNCTVKV